MSRNLIVCLDGTDNQFGAQNTNVVRVYQSLLRDPHRQVAYYDPGVGTIWEPGTLSKVGQKVHMLLGLGFGLGVTRNVAEAYSFLMQHHRPDDRIFVFGFSRGALEARALAGMIYRCGLLEAQLPSLEQYAMRMAKTPGNNAVLRDFRDTFARDVAVDFLGVWDTVTSMGNVWSPIYWPHATTNPSVGRIAHAIAIDERRAFFRPNRWNPVPGQQVDELWFAGVHSDIGGGYSADSGRLWAITLRWMMGHARAAGLLVNDARWTGIIAAAATAVPDYASDQHDSMTVAWKALELVPKGHRDLTPAGTWKSRVMLPALHGGFRGRVRTLRPSELVHRSAVERFVARPDYRPQTLLNAGLNDTVAKVFLATTDEAWRVPW